MLCPHCNHNFAPDLSRTSIKHMEKDADGEWAIQYERCQNLECRRLIIQLIRGKFHSFGGASYTLDEHSPYSISFVRPKSAMRNVPPEVPEALKQDFVEACLVLSDSPKASAALSRRCLQHLLHDYARIKARDLATEIQMAIDSKKLPSHIEDSIDAIRNIGNFAAHPLKSQQTGLIEEVVPGEAEWTLDVLEMLFDFYFVLPAKAAQRRAALNAKLQSAGKPPMK